MSELHSRCHKPVLFTEVSKGYYAQCPECDEDVFSFEVEEAEVFEDTEDYDPEIMADEKVAGMFRALED